MLEYMFWVAFGATIGWTAAIIRNEKDLRISAIYILAGGLGGLAGGSVGGMLDPAASGYHPVTTGLMFAVFGATAFVLCIGFIVQKHSGQHN